MRNLIRFWNQNRRQLIIIIAIIVFAFILIQVTNNLFSKMTKGNILNTTNDSAKEQMPVQSVISDIKVPETITKENVNIIEKFVKLCNEKKVQEAYNLLSDDCKNNIYPSIEIFKQKYYNNIFKTNKTCKLELWLANNGAYTYKVTYLNDNLLATGGIKGTSYEDYISIVYQKGENKININRFIIKQPINTKTTAGNIELSVNYKLIYKDYEIYNTTIINNNNKTILISDGAKLGEIYIIDQNKVEYTSFINEIPLNDLIIPSRYQKTINIKFNKLYGTERIIRTMKLKNVILDYDKYLENKKDETIPKINIDINI